MNTANGNILCICEEKITEVTRFPHTFVLLQFILPKEDELTLSATSTLAFWLSKKSTSDKWFAPTAKCTAVRFIWGNIIVSPVIRFLISLFKIPVSRMTIIFYQGLVLLLLIYLFLSLKVVRIVSSILLPSSIIRNTREFGSPLEDMPHAEIHCITYHCK